MTEPSRSLTPSEEERNWAMVAHLGPAVAAIVSAGFLSFLVPLVILLVEKERSEFVRAQAKESLNFRITMLIAYGILGFLWIPAIFSGVGICCLGPIHIAAVVIDILFGIIAALQVHEGKPYRYPFAIRVID